MDSWVSPQNKVFPTHVGVFPFSTDDPVYLVGLPHARGGVSDAIFCQDNGYESSPRTWGCFSLCPLARRSGSVFPTHVGVFPPGSGDFDTFRRLPHARGGVSVVYVRPFTAETSSPRTWGCFSSCQRATLIRRVFPTHVGVFLVDHFDSLTSRSLPHARGGVSGIRVTGSGLAESSPRTWGCFHPASLVLPHAKVFPTHVGGFPVLFRKFRRRICLPHARGGVSYEGSTSIGVLESSLHMWDLAISGILVLE